MELVEENFRDAVMAHKAAVLEELGRRKPKKVVAVLESNGWPREWACDIVAGMEKNIILRILNGGQRKISV